MDINFGQGGDATNNQNWRQFPQNALVISDPMNVVVGAGATPLWPAEHMAPATYNIWRNIDFGAQKHPTNLGVREVIKEMYSTGRGVLPNDFFGMVTVGHLAVVKGIYLMVNSAQADTVFDVVRLSTGEVIMPAVDASATSIIYRDIENLIVPPDTNEQFGIRIVSWKNMPASDADPCGVYQPCADTTLCVTMNVFMWSPVAAHFCKSDPCFGVNIGSPLAVGTAVPDRATPFTVQADLTADSTIADTP